MEYGVYESGEYRYIFAVEVAPSKTKVINPPLRRGVFFIAG